MKILITGGSGLIAGRLAEHLLASQDLHIVLASRSSKLSIEIDHNVSVKHINWFEASSIDEVCAGADIIFHCAAPNAAFSELYPLEAYKANVLGTYNLIDAAVKARVKRLIYLSTAHVYGSSLKGCVTEKQICTPTTHYAIGHRVAEDLVRLAHQRGRIEGVVVRMSNAFGAPVNVQSDCWGLLINDLARQAVTKGIIRLKSSGLQYRDFLPLAYAVRALAYLIQLESFHLKDSLFNLGSGRSVQIINVAHQVLEKSTHILKNRVFLEFSAEANLETIDQKIFEYNIQKLQKSGFSDDASDFVEYEINRLLNFCLNNTGYFSNEKGFDF